MKKRIAIVSAGPTGHETWKDNGIHEQWDTIIMVNSAAMVRQYGPCDVWVASDKSWMIDPTVKPAHPIRRHLRTMESVIRCIQRGEMPHIAPHVPRCMTWQELLHFKRGVVNFSFHVALLEAVQEKPADIVIFGHDCSLVLEDCAGVEDKSFLSPKRWAKEAKGVEEITDILLQNDCTVSYRHGNGGKNAGTRP